MHATFRFYGPLGDFLPAARRGTTFEHAFNGRASVKDMIESLGVPHPEIDLILSNGRAVDFSHAVRDGDRISVYPFFEQLEPVGLLRVRPPPPPLRFVCDVHLGRLAALLRMLGFDTAYSNDLGDAELARVSSAEARILLTRDRGLLKRSPVVHGYCVRANTPRQQILEAAERFGLRARFDPFTRCMRCNGLLGPARTDDAAKVPPRSRAAFGEFRACTACGNVYWPGSHHRRMTRFIAALGSAG